MIIYKGKDRGIVKVLAVKRQEIVHLFREIV